MLQFLQVLKMVLVLLPELLTAVRAMEAVMPESGQGQQKLAALRTVVEGVYKATTDSLPAFEVLWAAISNAVGTLVNVLNVTGVFKK